MSKKMMIRTPLFILILIAVLAFGWYSYFLTKQNNEEKDIDLFSFVPQDVIAIWETDNIYEAAKAMQKTSYHSHYDSLHISDLLSFLIGNIDDITDIKTHGINKNLNQIITSFHLPNSARDQVLYSQLTSKQQGEIEKQIRRNIPRSLQPKTLKYRNEEIVIYPIKNDDFIACYYNPDFFAISYQEKLIEDVIDTYLDKHSILTDSVFTNAREKKKGHAESTLYLRTISFPFEKEQNLWLFAKENPGQWIEYDIKMNRDAIYLSGTSFLVDSFLSLSNIIGKESPIYIFPSHSLPESTFFLQQAAVSDLTDILSLINQQQYPIEKSKDHTEKVDSALFVFLKNNVNSYISSFMFTNPDKQNSLSSVIYIPLKNSQFAENNFKKTQSVWINRPNSRRYIYPKYHFNNQKAYFIYELPEFTLLDRLSGITKDNIKNYHACFYEDCLLISPDQSSLTHYIDIINKGETKENDLLYQECIAGLSPESNAILVTDLGKTIDHKDNFRYMVPKVFLENDEFFRNFILAIQYTYTNGVLSPHISLVYKGEEL